jgi:2-dehydro-3-deoxy-L-rhamnonate dehydrogenase (NAD+)
MVGEGRLTLYADRFAGRTAIITGGASGLGRAVAKRFVAEGGKVALWDVNADWLAEAKVEVGATHTARVDVSDAATVASAADETARALGRVDVLVCSAGITGATAPVHEYPLDSWERVVAINLNGLFYCCRAVVPHMLANGYGRIVNVASVAGKEGNPNASAYSASKAGVIGLTKSLGKELAGKGIIANALTPATFESPILDQLPASQVDYMRSKIPMGRLGEAEESAAMILFMASEECSFTTASTFDTSGGRTTY